MQGEEKKLTGYPSIDKPWLKYYSEEKQNFDIPNCSIYDYMSECNKNYIDNIALEYFGTRISYRQMLERIDICANAFLSLGVEKGDAVSFCNPATPEIYYAFYALNKIGAVANLIDPRTNATRIEEFIRGADSEIVIYTDAVYPKIERVLNQPNIRKAICVSAEDSWRPFKKIIYKAKHYRKENTIPKDRKYLTWQKFMSYGHGSYVNKLKANEDMKNLPAGIIYTSGTTGVPKGAVISNQNILAMVKQSVCASAPWERNDRFLGMMPPFIAYGLVCGFALPLCFGMTVTIIPKFELYEFASYLLKHRPNHILGVPAHIEYLMYSPELAKTDLSEIKSVIVGGDKLNPEMEIAINKFLLAHHCKCKVSKGYGLSEMSSSAVFPNCEASNKIGSVGIPLVNNNIKVIDSESGEELGYDQIGEICLTGPTLIEGYWKNKEEDRKVFWVEEGGRWLHTGDRGYIDKDGVVFFNDRVKRIIVRSDGHNVWPSDSEKIIEKDERIANVCVVGTKPDHGKQGEVVTAYIVIKEEVVENPDRIIDSLRRELLKSLPTRDIPEKYIIKKELPLTPNGKVDYRVLEQKQ